MPHFYHSREQVTISANHKVMSSTLSEQNALRQISHRKFIRWQLQNCWLPLRSTPAYLVVRNPYQRLESFFKDKLRQHPGRMESEPDFFWQDCQKMLFPYLELSDVQDSRTIQQSLLNTSFGQFLNILPEIYEQDPHLIPQHRIGNYQIPLTGQPCETEFTRIFQLERLDDMTALSSLGLNLSERRNSTRPNENFSLSWIQENLEIVETLYREDFRRFGYEYRRSGT